LEQDIDQQEVEERDLDEGYQSHGKEQEFTHASTKDNEDLVEEREPEDIKHDDEVLMCAPPSDEAIEILFLLHKKKRMRLVTFLFSFWMIPYSMIQKVKKKGNLWMG
jgi:FMN phosphatase YigB (HAD superfamily)